MNFSKRSVDCGALRLEHEGQEVILNGWAHRIRDLGGLMFIDLRDRTGLIQLYFDPQNVTGDRITNETCLGIKGIVKPRTPGTRNANMGTGDIEIVVTEYSVLGPAKPLPFPVSDESSMLNVNEELRIKYRYLDIRRPSMYRKLAIRAGAIKRIRHYLDNEGFLEIETPIFTKSTPEGARDYLVPYRLEPGKFYALPQSPQQYKQLLMVAGVERYYQIAKCFRDEAQRSDRQPEFTQLDLEMSFIVQEDILALIEGMTVSVLNGLIDEFKLNKEKISGFTRLTYDESMLRYGCDKPDLRFDLELFDISPIVAESNFGVFKNAIEGGALVRGVRYPGGAELSRKEVGILEDFCKEFGAKGMASIAFISPTGAEGEVPLTGGLAAKSSIAKFFTPEQLQAIAEAGSAEAGDLMCFIADAYSIGNNILYRLRNEIGDRCGLRDITKLNFCFVLDFPLVEWNATDQRWDASHHPFTSPKAADMEFLTSDPARVRADCYDLVCNGTEWASGSIRINNPEIQAQVFTLLGIDEKTQKDRFGHILEAFTYGAPPHGGIAPGIDRLIMFLCDDDNIREVIAFPKIGLGQDPMMDAPSTIDPLQWAEMGLRQS